MFSTIKYIYLPDCASSVQSFFIPSCCEFSPINQKSGWRRKIDDRSEDHVTIDAYKIGASGEEVMTGKVTSKVFYLFAGDTHTSTNRKTGKNLIQMSK